jgi:hypothetical protein
MERDSGMMRFSTSLGGIGKGRLGLLILDKVRDISPIE